MYHGQLIDDPTPYNLGAADWNSSDAISGQIVAGPSRQYEQFPSVNSPNGYCPSQAGRTTSVDNSTFPNHTWHSDMANVPYETPVLSSMYSAERTSLSGDYPSPWQTTERASVRLVARGAVTGSSLTNPDIYAHYFEAAQQMCDHEDELSHTFPRRSEDRTRAPQAFQKRGASDAEDTEEPPKSKRKLSTKPAERKVAPAAAIKRGYTAKKRSEAAQIAAQNEFTPNVMYALAPKATNKEKDDTPYQVVAVAISADTNLRREVQTSRCMSNRYKNEEFPRCVSCTRRWAGDTCRFQGIRSFLRESEGNIVGFCFSEHHDRDVPAMTFPNAWNVPLEKSHIRETKRTVASALLPTLREELKHISLPEVIYRPRESEVRATCDTCNTSIFSSSWMCRTCGREACSECFLQIRSLTIEPDGASQAKLDELQELRDKHSHGNPFFLSCLRRTDHGAKHFSPMSRFSKSELTDAIESMEQLLRDEGISISLPTVAPGSLPPDSVRSDSDRASMSFHGSAAHKPPDPPSPLLSNASDVTLVSNGDLPNVSDHPPSPDTSGSSAEIPCHEIRRFRDSELTEEVFRSLWAQGDPLLVTDVARKFKIKWSPEYFMEKYGTQTCLIIECQTDANKRISVAEFFGTFGQYDGRQQCWKLKDWPPSTDFKTAFPELYEDFSQAVPVPNYVRRDGALNIASHFPFNTVAPDLGPKMYNANANQETSGNKGSTRLHMDMADALNIMIYAAPDPDGQEGCAAWDLFRAQDSDKIRKFLREKFKSKIKTQDPIHSQQVYLDDDLRRQLWQEYGVLSYRLYQRPGEAVFIPAGCAHQVRNLSDCIKAAIDFVSPENIQRCEKLTQEFREQNQLKAWKEDVLQLRTMMWFAWLSCCRQEKLRR
ncbi:hypothetical protein B0H10DRAFT_1779740 [Mycena sp. CBHHK59/15]|nr:hypothetical protein B0H10DRAFT_1779740 [Mycena sp. CBHHK59/15]